MTAIDVIQAILPGTLNCRTTLGGGTSVAQGLFIEMFLTAMVSEACVESVLYFHKQLVHPRQDQIQFFRLSFSFSFSS